MLMTKRGREILELPRSFMIPCLYLCNLSFGLVVFVLWTCIWCFGHVVFTLDMYFDVWNLSCYWHEPLLKVYLEGR